MLRRMSRAAPAVTQAPPSLPAMVPPSTIDLAWLAVVPAVAIVAPALRWLAPPLARTVMPTPSWHVFPSVRSLIVPEPLEQLRYFMALATPVLIIGFALLLRWAAVRRSWSRARWCGPGVVAVQLLVVAGAGYCWADQADRRPWFTGVNLVVALVVAGALLALVRRGLVARSIGRAWTVVAMVAAVLLTVVWLLPALYGNAAITHASGILTYHLQFTMNELLTVANDQAPLVGYASQYTKLLPYLVAPVLGVTGTSVMAVTGIMWALSLASMLAVYLALRTVTGNAVAALLLYVPFLAVSNYTLVEEGPERILLANLYGVVPLRVTAPFVVAWLMTLELKRPHRGARVALFVAGGLAAANNIEYGLPCLGALFVGLLCARNAGGWTWSECKRLVTEAVAGCALAVVAVCVLTLATSGTLPDLKYLAQFNRAFAIEGFGLVPMPAYGLHVVVFLTFCAALTVAAVASATGSAFARRSPVLVGALAYSGVLGLGSYAYWVGRSAPDALFSLFPTWGFTVCLLVWTIVREAGPRRSPALRTVAVPAVLVLTFFGLMATVVVQIPSPAAQIRRLTAESLLAGDPPASSLACVTSPRADRPCPIAPASFEHKAAVRFVEANTEPGERVAILTGMGHSIAMDSGVRNVSPYSHPDAIAFAEQMDFLFQALERAKGTKVFLGLSYPEIAVVLRQRGFVPGAYDATSELTEWQPARR